MPRKGGSKRGDCFLCGRPSTTKCDKCKLIYYCSKEHQRYHRQRDYCFPYKISWKANSKAVVATRDIQPLELILYEWNLAVGPVGSAFKNGGGRRDLCVGCLRPIEDSSDVQECGMCGLPICSDQCQVGDHVNECQVLRGARDHDLDLRQSAVLPLKVRWKKTDSEYAKWQFLTDVNRSIPDLAECSGWDKSRRKLVKFLSRLCPDEDPECVDRTVQLIKRFSVSTLNGYGIALFPIFALFQHSCICNAKFQVYPDHNLAVQAQTKIQKGQEITVSLANTLEPTWKRRARLVRDFQLSCRCQRCADPSELGANTSALKCSKCGSGKGRILPKNPLDSNSVWSCTIHTGTAISAKNAQQLQLDLQRDMYQNGLVTTIDQLDSKIQMYSEFLDSNHGLILAAKRSLVQCFSQIPSSAIDRRHLELVRNLCLQQLLVSDRIDPGFPDWKGNVLKHLSATELNLARMDMEDNKIPRQEFLLRVRKAMLLVQEGVRCKSCVKIDRSSNRLTIVDESDSSYMSDCSTGSSLR